MESVIIFEEIQQFARKSQGFFKIAIGLLLLGSIISFLSGFENGKELATGLLAGVVIAGLVNLFLSKTRLITRICSDGIYVRFPPLQGSFSRFAWEDIDRIHIRTYSPLREYGGWGIRLGAMGTAYNVSGNVGVQLILKNGSRLLIGTNQPEEVARVLQRLGKLDPYF